MSTKVILGAVGAALVALALWLATAGGREAPPPLDVASTGTADVGTHGGPEHAEVEPGPAGELAGVTPAPGATAGDHRRAQAEREPVAAPHEVRGRITDTRGQPLAGAAVSFSGEDGELALTSGDDGRVAAELVLAPGRETLAVRAACEGYLARTVELDLRRPFEIELQALPVLAGRVLDPEGRPAAPPGYVNARVLDAVTRESRASQVELAADGSYRLERLPLGRLVSVEARARGFAERKLSVERELAADSTTELNVELDPGAVVTGTVLDARTRAPVAGATVWMDTFAPEEGSVHPVTTADETGRFRLEGASEDVSFQDGRRVVFFTLVARAEGYAASPTTGYGAPASDEHAYDFEMLLEPAGCSLRIEVVRADGRPAPGATVWAIDAQSNPFFETADEHGVHAFEDLPAGTMGLWIAHADSAVVRVGNQPIQVEIGGRHALRFELELAPGEARRERVVLRPPGEAAIAGRVVDVQGRGVPDFVVRSQLNFQLGNLMLASGWDEVNTDPDGRYRFEGLHPGTYQVWAHGEGTAMACAQPANTYVDVTADQRTEVVELLVGACLTIEGRVEGAGIEIEALDLTALDPASGDDLAGTRPAADGSFRFEPLVAREYVIVLHRDGVVLDRATVGPTNASAVFLRAD